VSGVLIGLNTKCRITWREKQKRLVRKEISKFFVFLFNIQTRRKGLVQRVNWCGEC